MKRTFAFLLAVLVVFTAHVAFTQTPSPDADPHHTDTFGHTRFWTYYTPYPSNYIGSPEWWQGDAFFGDWWGVRNWLDDSGVEIIANYTTNLAGNPVGGKSQGFTYTDNIYFGVQLDFGKLVGWQGASLAISGLDRNGTSLSQQKIGNQFTVQQIYGGETAMFYALAFEQKLFDENVSIKLGRFATGDDFASSPIYWLYMNNGIDGNPQALPVNAAFSAYPWAVWAARLRVNPTKDTVAQFGVYQASNRIFNREYHGVDWSIRSDDGVMLISQFGWNPEFFKRAVPSSAVSDGKQTQGKNDKKAIAETTMKGYQGHYWFGFYLSPWNYPQFGSTDRSTNAYGFYWHADQMVYQERPGSDEGLTIWSAFVLSPQQSIAKLPFQANGGLVYKGLLPYRPQDQTMFGAIFGKFSGDYAETVASSPSGGVPTYELVFEVGHRVNLNKFLYVQPNIQWIINPGGTGQIPNALVLGSQIGVTF